MATWTGKQSPSVLMSISVAFLYASAKIFLPPCLKKPDFCCLQLVSTLQNVHFSNTT